MKTEPSPRHEDAQIVPLDAARPARRGAEPDEGRGEAGGARAGHLHAGEHEFRQIVAAIGDALIVVDARGAISYSNDAAARMFGYSLEHAVGKPLRELIVSERYCEELQQAIAGFAHAGTGEVVGRTNEVEALRKDGEAFTAELTVSLVGLHDGWHAIGLVHDVTQRKRDTERLLSQSRSRFEDLVNTVDGIVWEADARNFDFTFVSRQAERILGYPTEDWLTPGFWAAHIHPEDRAEAVAYCVAATRELKPHQFEYRMVARDGRVIWVRDIVTVLAEAGVPSVVRGIMFDISRQKRTDEALAGLLAEHQAIFDNAVAGIALIKDRTVLNANRRFEQIFGLDQGEAIGLSCATLFPDEAAFESAGASMYPEIWSGRVWEEELLYRRKDGTLFWCSVSGKAVDARDPSKGSIWVYTDADERVRTERALKDSEARFRSISAAAADAIVTVDAEHRITYWNPAAERTFGYSADEAVAQEIDRLLFPPESRESARERLSLCFHDGDGGWTTETVAMRRGGTRFPIELTLSRFRHREQWVALGMVRDISARKAADAELRLAATVFANNAESVIITNPSGEILKVNRAFCEMTGYTEEQAVGRNPRLLKSGRQERDFYATLWATLLVEGRWQGELWNRRQSGELFPALLSITAVKDERGEITHFIGMLSDLTQRKRSENLIQHLANYDELTKLPNRLLMRERLTQAIANAQQSGRKVAVVSLDLDRFKNVNDTLGHHVGDQVLERVGERLLECVRQGDTVSRYSGDQFVVVLADLAQSEDAALVVEHVLGKLSRPIQVAEQEFVLSVSCGIAVFPADGADASTLLKNADAAMNHAKGEGGDSCQFYTQQMQAMAYERLALEKHLRAAIERNEFIIYYQPQLALRAGELVGAEALIRWKHPEFGMVSPAKFIPLAEETGLILAIGDWVLRTACLQARAWHELGYREVTVAVNLSPRQLRQQSLLGQVEQVLQETRIRPDRLELELTESMLMENPDRAIAVLRDLKKLGVRLSVDDFGTGYSSLSYLKRFPIDKLKIDQSFVRDLSSDANDAAITEAVIALGRTLQLEVVAEGVETAEQVDFLRWYRCDAMQGYFYSPPVPADAFLKMMQEARRLPVSSL